MRPPIRYDARFVPADLLMFRLSDRARWQPGYVVAVSADSLSVRPARSRRIFVIAEGLGEVKALHGQALIKVQERIGVPRPRQAEAVALVAAAPQMERRAVSRGPAPLRAVPKPRRRARSGEYLDFVRGWACCGCGVPGPSEAHHVGPRGVGQKADDFGAVPLCRDCHQHITDTNCLPGRDRTQTEMVILRFSRDLLVEWCAAPAADPYIEALEGRA